MKVEGNRPVFDIIAGSSIGAVNAAIIVGNIKKSIIETTKKDGSNDDNGKKLEMNSIWELQQESSTSFGMKSLIQHGG
jgi:predicted acylesterase/phospholipase RssA